MPPEAAPFRRKLKGFKLHGIRVCIATILSLLRSLRLCPRFPHGLRRGLYSGAASRLVLGYCASLGVTGTTKTQSARAVFAGSHQQQFAVFLSFVGLREIPHGALRLVIASSAHNAGARVFILKLVGPLPDVAEQIHHAHGTCSFGVRGNIIRAAQITSLIGLGNRCCVPIVSPGINPRICALSGILPFPLMGQALPCPAAVGASVLERDP